MNHEIQLFLRWPEQGDDVSGDMNWLQGVDALVIDPSRCDQTQFEHAGVEKAVIRNGDPARDACWTERSAWWVADDGLEQVARRRDECPELNWIPHISVSRARVSYRFSGPAVGEGFSFYIPDTAAIKGWRVDGTEYSLHEAVIRATELGFAALWLDSPEAEARGDGLELDLLDKVRGGPVDVWLSGGASEPRHLNNLARIGGATAVVIDERLVRSSSVAALREAIIVQAPVPEAVPLHFEGQPTQAG